MTADMGEYIGVSSLFEVLFVSVPYLCSHYLVLFTETVWEGSRKEFPLIG